MAKKNTTYTITDWEIDTPIDLKNIKTLVADGVIQNELSFVIDNNKNLVLKRQINETEYYELIFYNYNNLKYLSLDESTPLIDLIEAALIDNKGNPFNAGDIKNKKLNGTNYNDVIDVELYEGIKNLTINAKSGNDDITLSNSYKSAKINAGNGINNVTLEDAGTVTVTSGSGKDTILIYDNGGVYNQTIKAGDGDNDITIERSGKSTVTTGSGSDTIDILSDGTKTIKAGNGTNNITVTGIGTTSITAGNGADNITVSNNTSSTTIKAGNGTNNIVVSDSKGKVTITSGNDKDEIRINTEGSVSVNSGKSDDTVNISNSSSATIKSLYGDNNITLVNKSAKKSTITTGLGSDIISIDGNSAATITAGNGQNEITLNGNGTNKVKTGKDGDTIDVKGGAYTDIYAGGGENTICVDNSASVGEITIMEEKVSALNKIVFSKKLNSNYVFSTSKDGKDLIVTNQVTDFKLTIKKYYAQNLKKQAEYKFYIDKTEYTLEELIESTSETGTLVRGEEALSFNFLNTKSTILTLTDTFSGKDYKYTIKSLNGNQRATLEYLANGRLVITGDYLQIDAADAQQDDIILLGGHNVLNTGDEADIIRLGCVIDANTEYYYKQSDYNTINSGSDKDYVTFLGTHNQIVTSETTDYVADMFENSLVDVDKYHNSVNGSNKYNDYVRYVKYNFGTSTINNQIEWFDQGGGGGDCRLFAILHSLSKSSATFNLRDYVDIEQAGENIYSVTFKNYSGDNKTYNVNLANLQNFDYVYGDLDVVLTDYALNRLISENQVYDKELLLNDYAGQKVDLKDTVQKAYYNTLSNYLFGTTETTFILYQNDYGNFGDILQSFWAKYKNGEMSNISIGIMEVPHNYKLGILSGHAYSVIDLTDNYITLLNPWDSADCLKLDLELFYSLKPCAIVYGEDYYNQNILIEQGMSLSNMSLADVNESYIDFVNYSVQNWIGVNTSDIVQYYEDLSENNTDILVPVNSF